MDLATWTKVLGLENIEVVAAEAERGEKGWHLSVVSTCLIGLCPKCHMPTGCRHMVRWQTMRDLSISGQPVFLDMQIPQFTCKPCNKDITVHPDCLLEGTHVTLRLAEAITDCVNVSTLSAASATYRLPESTVKGIFELIIQRRLAVKERTLKPITQLGIDEVYLEVHDDPQKSSDADKPAATPTPIPAEAGEKINRAQRAQVLVGSR